MGPVPNIDQPVVVWYVIQVQRYAFWGRGPVERFQDQPMNMVHMSK